VLLVEGDYPTLHAPFERGGYEAVWFRPGSDGTIPMNALEEVLLREKPDILAISHVQWRTGYMVDLLAITEICRTNGILTVIDATQSWGSVPLDVEAMGIDILGASGYKWPLAGFGNGFMYLSEAASNEIKDRSGIDPISAITGGHNDPVALVRLAHALERMERIGVAAIAERVNGLFEYAVDELDRIGVKVLNGRDPACRAGILMIEGDEALLSRSKEKGIRVALRGQGIRVGIHYYNTVMDIDRLVKALSA
jgi:selenocysteine lyase/cysteine desulfurase